MDTQSQSAPYPGERATADELFRLAEEYRRAASLLVQSRRPSQPFSRAPYHLAAIHAIELYLNALLLSQGMTPCDLRKLQHDLSARIGHDLAAGFGLTRRTTAHLVDLSKRREYLIVRCGTDQMKEMSQINRLQATLEEIQSKVAKRLGMTSATATPLSVQPGPVERHRKPGKTAERPAAEAHVLIVSQPQVA
jgi:hypothetical protein